MEKPQKTLILLKPDVLQRGIMGEIITRFERVGAKIVGLKLLVSKEDTAKLHYTDDITKRRGEKIRELMIKMLMSGPIVAMAVEGVEMVELGRKMVGATEPKAALPGTIRGDYSHVSYGQADKGGKGIFNLIHASANPEEAEAEINVWFKPEELYDYSPLYTRYTIETYFEGE